MSILTMAASIEKNARISVIIPLFNHKNTIGACIEHIRAQTYPHIEIIVVDDGSSDHGHAIAESYEEVRVLRQANAGAPTARNNGFSHSSGEFVIFCDADVLMEPNMLEVMHSSLLENPGCVFSYGAFLFGNKLFPGVPFNREQLFVSNYISTMSLIRRQDFPGFDEKLKRFQDWDLWLTMVKAGKSGVCCSVDTPLFKAVIDGKSRIGTSWMPSFFYRIPRVASLLMPERMRKYREARDVICAKHPEVQKWH